MQLRHTQMLNNLGRLVHADRACLPSQFFQSAWYWCRKEHQTRLEFALRGVAPLPDRDSLFVVLDGNDRFCRNEVGDSTLLFRYTKQRYAEAIRDSGVVRVAPATSYRDMEGDVARADDEMVKTTWLPREHVST